MIRWIRLYWVRRECCSLEPRSPQVQLGLVNSCHRIRSEKSVDLPCRRGQQTTDKIRPMGPRCRPQLLFACRSVEDFILSAAGQDSGLDVGAPGPESRRSGLAPLGDVLFGEVEFCHVGGLSVGEISGQKKFLENFEQLFEGRSWGEPHRSLPHPGGSMHSRLARLVLLFCTRRDSRNMRRVLPRTAGEGEERATGSGETRRRKRRPWPQRSLIRSIRPLKKRRGIRSAEGQRRQASCGSRVASSNVAHPMNVIGASRRRRRWRDFCHDCIIRIIRRHTQVFLR